MLEKVFSVKNDERKTHKVVTVLGAKLKIRTKKKSFPVLPYLEIHLCDHCNLNCKGCGHFCYLVRDEIFTDLEQFTKDINELSKKIFIKQIRLMGGEPLLHKQVNEFINITREAYPKSDIRLVTNGILLPTMKEDFWETCRKNKIKIDMSKYPIVGNKFAEYLDLLDDNRVSLGQIHLAKRFFSQRNPKGDSDYKKAFSACISKKCVNLWHSKLYICPAVFRYYYNQNNEEKLEMPKGYDIYSLSGEEIMKYMNKPDNACRFCLLESIEYPWEQHNESK